MDMVVVAVVQVHGLTQTKTLETLVGLVVEVAVVLASLQVTEDHKIQVDMVLLVVADHQIKMEKVKLVLTHPLMLVVMVVQVVNTEKEEDRQDLVETEEIEMTLLRVVLLEVPTEVVVEHQVLMVMV